MRITAIIPHFFTERLRNLSMAIESLRASAPTPPIEILVWNNDVPLMPGIADGASVIQSPRNIGCQARFLAALMARGDYVLFQDNDLRVQRRTLENMAAWAEHIPNSIISLDGYAIPVGAGYGARRAVSGVTEPERISVTLGRLELMERALLLRLLADFPYGDGARMDDLELSAAAARAGIECWVVPTGADSGYVNLPTGGVGACLTPDHYEERDRVYRRLFEVSA
jgi:hypothetical protein